MPAHVSPWLWASLIIILRASLIIVIIVIIILWASLIIVVIILWASLIINTFVCVLGVVIPLWRLAPRMLLHELQRVPTCHSRDGCG